MTSLNPTFSRNVLTRSECESFKPGRVGYLGISHIVLARPRLRPARGIRRFDSAGRGAAGFSGLANGGTEILMRGKCLGAISILRLLFHWRVPAEVTPIKSNRVQEPGPALRILERQNHREANAYTPE